MAWKWGKANMLFTVMHILMSYLRTRRGSLWGRDAAMVKVIVAVRTVLAVVERHAARCGSHATRDMMQPLHGVSLT